MSHGDRKTDSQPRTLEEFIGQPKIREILTVSIGAAKARGGALGHILLRGPTGCGKRTLARVIANEMRVKMTSTSGRDIARAGDLAAIITNLGECDIVCIADIQRLSKPAEDRLCQAMRDFALDIVIGKGFAAKTVDLPLPPFTVVGTISHPERVSHQLRQSFDYVVDFEPYEVSGLVKLVQRISEDVGVRIDENARLMIARACGGSLAEARRLLMQTRDYAQARADGVITAAVAHEALAVMAPEHSPAALQPAPQTSQMIGTGRAPLTWQGFEDLIAELFSALGYRNVKVTQRTGDEGKDIIMERADPLRGITRVYVECKHWSSGRVGIKEVQVLHSAVMRDPQVHEGMLVTTGSFTNQARAYARQIGFIELVDLSELRELALKAGVDLDSRIGK
jgi:Holliday junction DNA helicase RuvB subunit